MSTKFARYDVMHGLVALRGSDRHDLLHRLCTQDCRDLKQPGRTTRALICTHQGRLLDWIELIEAGDALYIACAMGRAQTLIDWLDGFTIMEDVSYRLVGEAVPSVLLVPELGAQWWQAPDEAAPASPGEGDVAALAGLCAALGLTQVPTPSETACLASSHSEDGVRVLRAHPALGVGLRLVALSGEVQLPAAAAAQTGAPRSALEWEARRLVAGLPSPEFEYAQPAMPFELRLVADNVHWHKGCYIGQEVVSRLEAYDKVARLSMGVVAADGAAKLAAHGPGAGKIYVDGKAQGRLTSFVGCRGLGADAPDDGFVGLATLKREVAAPQPAELHIAAAAQGEEDQAGGPVVVPVTLCARPLWAAASTP